MKTALVKTDLWDDDTFYDLNIDTKIVYLLLLTSPERGVGRTFKMSDRIISARSGLNLNQISVCKQQLEDDNIISFYKGWVNLGFKSSFIQPVKGKLTEITLQRELKDIPDDVNKYFNGLTDQISPVTDRSDSRESHVLVNDNDLVHVTDNDKPVVYGKPEINELFEYWEAVTGLAITSNQQKNRQAANNLLKKHGIEAVKKYIDGVNFAQQTAYAPKISSFMSLQSRLDDLLVWGKSVNKTKQNKVVKV